MKTALVNLLEHFPPPAESAAQFASLTCKFVLIREDDTLNLVLGYVGKYQYHASLISQFCQDRHIRASWVKKPDVIKIRDQRAAVLGGGWAEIVPGTKTCRIYGRSNVYGPYDRADVRAVLADQKLLAGYQTTVE